VVSLQLCVTTPPEVHADRVRLDGQVLAGASPVRQVRLGWYHTRQRPRVGDTWRIETRLRAPRGLVNPNGRDYALGLLAAGIDATGTVRTAQRVAAPLCLRGRDRLLLPVQRLRSLLAERLRLNALRPVPATNTGTAAADAALAVHGSGLLLALALGFQDAVPDAQWRLFSLTGVSHLVAISGLHVTLFAWLVLSVARWVQGRGRAVPTAALGVGVASLAVLAAFAYALLAGGNLPALRTVWMLAVAFGVRLLRRQAGVSEAWSAALVTGLLLEPFAPALLGFWLSFGAVGALLWAEAGQVRAAVAPPRGLLARGGSHLRLFLLTQCAVTAVLTPVLAGSVGSPSWVSLPVNALAIPLCTLLVVPAVLLVTLMVAVAPALAGSAVHTVAVGLGVLVQGLSAAAAWPAASWSLPALPLSGAMAGVVCALAACCPLLWRRIRVLAALLWCLLLFWPPVRPAMGDFAVTMLDVGQGSATVIETATSVWVFDPGPVYGPETDAGGRVVVPFLRARGWHQLQAVVVSHADNDHSGGLRAVLERYPQATVWWGGDEGADNHAQSLCRAGLSWRRDGVRFTFLHPGAAVERDDNAGSCVLQVAGLRHSALLLADIPRQVEERLVAAGLPPATLVLVAHHGSTTASGAVLRQALQLPHGTGEALISAGYRNRWGFPKPAVRQGWQEAGRRVWVTGEHGAVTVTLPQAGPVRVSAARLGELRWWRPPG
jgi:competence protein ComEC